MLYKNIYTFFEYNSHIYKLEKLKKLSVKGILKESTANLCWMNARHNEFHNSWRLAVTLLLFDRRSLGQVIVITSQLFIVVSVGDGHRYKRNGPQENRGETPDHVDLEEQGFKNYNRSIPFVTTVQHRRIQQRVIFPWCLTTYLLLIWKEKQSNSLFINLWSTKHPPMYPLLSLLVMYAISHREVM